MAVITDMTLAKALNVPIKAVIDDSGGWSCAEERVADRSVHVNRAGPQFSIAAQATKQRGSSSSSLVPTDQISLNFAKIEVEYAEQGNDGKLKASIKTGYDLKQGVSL